MPRARVALCLLLAAGGGACNKKSAPPAPARAPAAAQPSGHEAAVGAAADSVRAVNAALGAVTDGPTADAASAVLERELAKMKKATADLTALGPASPADRSRANQRGEEFGSAVRALNAATQPAKQAAQAGRIPQASGQRFSQLLVEFGEAAHAFTEAAKANLR